jgi:hypothetical protein
VRTHFETHFSFHSYSRSVCTVELPTLVDITTSCHFEACACAVVLRLYCGLYDLSNLICVRARCLLPHPEALRTHLETHPLPTHTGDLSVLWSHPPLLALPPATVPKHAPVLWSVCGLLRLWFCVCTMVCPRFRRCYPPPLALSPATALRRAPTLRPRARTLVCMRSPSFASYAVIYMRNLCSRPMSAISPRSCAHSPRNSFSTQSLWRSFYTVELPTPPNAATATALKHALAL